MSRKVKPSMDKIVGDAMRKVLQPKAPRKRRAKSEADLWYEEMKSGFVEHGSEDLKSARAKMAAPPVEETDTTSKKVLKG
jgi:hypothetical protein